MLKECLKAIIASPLPAYLLTASRRNAVCVLTYHRIINEPGVFQGLHVDTFRSQMCWIKKRCHVLHPHELERALTHGRFNKPPVLVTFDDGYRDFHDVAFPILQELNIPCLVFVATAFIGTGQLLWTDVVDAAVQLTDQRIVCFYAATDEPMLLTDHGARRRIAGLIKEHLKGLDDRIRRTEVSRLLDELGIINVEAMLPRQMLTWPEVRATTPLATYGGHSHQHPILASLSADEQARDLTIATDILREQVGVAPRYFAYPNGRRVDFTEQTQAILRSLGYVMAFSTVPGLNGLESDRFALHRQYTSLYTIGELAWQVMGGSSFLRRRSA
jgi:peptidoglycan/xylan/chitin deacetylase (PgdA/CDA1 family)